MTFWQARYRLAAILVAALAIATESSTLATEPAKPRVLLLYPYSRLLPAVGRVDEAFRAALKKSGRSYDLLTEYLDIEHFPSAGQREIFAQYLSQRYAAAPPQILVAAGDAAFEFLMERRQTLFPGTPVVFVTLSEKGVALARTDKLVTGVPTAAVSENRTLAALPTILPGLREIVVISEVPRTERGDGANGENANRQQPRKVKITYLAQRPFAEVLDKVSHLPPHTAVFFIAYLRDPNGTVMISADAAAQVAKRSSVPVFGKYETYLDRGVVGGDMIDLGEYGSIGGQIVARLLTGETPAQIGFVSASPNRFRFDARQLKRWGIARSGLPAGSEILYDQKSVWQEHPRVMAGIVVALLLQAALSMGLFLQNRRRHRIETALGVSEERYREVVESQTDLVCRFKPDTTLTFVTEAYCRFLGKERDELIGKPFINFVPEERRPGVLASVRQLTESRIPVLQEQEMLRPDGSVAWMEWRRFAIVDGDGSLIELQGIGRDMTEQRRATRALAESERKLAHASRLALAGELTASLAHELNQPLTAIASNAAAGKRFLANGISDPQMFAELLGDVFVDARRAGDIIHGIHHFVRKAEGTRRLVSMNEVILEVLRLLHSDLVGRSTTVETELATPIPDVQADPIHLQQVLLNLILNSLEAMQDTPANKRRVLISTHTSNGWVQAAVRDYGLGLPKDDPDKVFSKFFSTKPTGMGMGLAIVRSIVEAHGGELGAESLPDGARFFFRVPSVRAHEVS